LELPQLVVNLLSAQAGLMNLSALLVPGLPGALTLFEKSFVSGANRSFDRQFVIHLLSHQGVSRTSSAIQVTRAFVLGYTLQSCRSRWKTVRKLYCFFVVLGMFYSVGGAVAGQAISVGDLLFSSSTYKSDSIGIV
jgi:hypothetical protein